MTGRDPPRNITSFEECNFFPTTKENIERCNYTRPTPVQKYAIPIIMRGRDLMACAQTGSGKTVSICLPLMKPHVNELHILCKLVNHTSDTIAYYVHN